MFNFADMFKNLSGLQGQVEEIRKRVARIHVTGDAGAGMVRVEANGEGVILNIHIDPDLMTPEGKGMVEELVISATNDALQKAKEAAAHEMKHVMGGLNIPGLDKLFGGGS